MIHALTGHAKVPLTALTSVRFLGICSEINIENRFTLSSGTLLLKDHGFLGFGNTRHMEIFPLIDAYQLYIPQQPLTLNVHLYVTRL
jgi:hypothetical protein